MTIEQLIDQIERYLADPMTNRVPVDRLEIHERINESLTSLAASDFWEFFKVNLQPLIQTEPGVRSYPLPKDFPNNFLRVGDADLGENHHAVQVDDGSSGRSMIYETVEQFYLRDLSQESNSRPEYYTIEALPSGGKQITLAPPPNSTSYTISGTYVPAEIRLQERDNIPPLIPNVDVIRYDVLRHLDESTPKWETEFNRSKRNLYYLHARNSPASLTMDRRLSRELV